MGGASKRGWTTWTIASVDKRVKAAIPMVLDCLNMKQIFSDWFRNMGAWSFALEPYYSENLTNFFDDPRFDKLADVVDPYTYRDRLTMPKMVISATGDEFFAPDDSYAWFDELTKTGPTYLRLLPNAEHGMIPPQGLSSKSIAHGIRAFHLAVHKQYSMPQVKWIRSVASRGDAQLSKNDDASDVLKLLDVEFKRVADNIEEYVDHVRDTYAESVKDESAIEGQLIKWNQVRVETINDRTWRAVVPPSYDGFRALMIEVSFSGPDDRSKLTFTSEVMITPDSRPFEKCHGTECYGY